MNDMLLVLSVTIGIVLAMVPVINAFFESAEVAQFQHTSELCRQIIQNRK